jgi:hypothetical protein
MLPQGETAMIVGQSASKDGTYKLLCRVPPVKSGQHQEVYRPKLNIHDHIHGMCSKPFKFQGLDYAVMRKLTLP